MKKITCIVLATVMFILLFAGAVSAQTELQILGVETYGDADNPDSRIVSVAAGENNYLIVPQTANFSCFPLRVRLTGEPDTLKISGKATAITQTKTELTLDLYALCGDGPYVLTLTAAKGSQKVKYRVEVRRTSAIGAMYLVSDDPQAQGRDWVESSPDKTNKATGRLLMQQPDGTVVYSNALAQIKGRGNSTWNGKKKPYQIKLSKKTDLLCTGDSSNACKTWVLLANYYDPTGGLHNTVAYDLAAALGMPFTVQSTPVDLFYDGEYRGMYLLSEKVEIASGRVALNSLDDANEDANPDIDLEQFPILNGSTSNGASYRYCEGMTDPESITGGYLLEMDYEWRATQEACWFRTKRGQYVTVKSPEYASKAEMDYIATLFQQFEDAINNGGTDPMSGRYYADLCDLSSIADCYLMNELTKNTDGWRSSAFFYKSEDEDFLHMGPVWDMDLCFGDGYYAEVGDAELKTEFYTLYDNFTRPFYDQGDFREEVRSRYTELWYPLLSQVLLGETDAQSENGSLHSLQWYLQRVDESTDCNSLLWDVETYHYSLYPGGDTCDSNRAFFKDYLEVRSQWLLNAYAEWNGETAKPLNIFRDVPDDAWYAADANRAAELGLLSGTGHNCYSPKMTLTRDQAVTAAWSLAGKPGSSHTAEFYDVYNTSWYYNALSWGVDNGVVFGLPDGGFGAKQEVTRQDLIVMLFRMAGEPEASGDVSGFDDSDRVKSYAKNAVSWALKYGLLYGDQNNKLNPRASLTRAELAAFVVRMYDYLH